MNDYNSNTNHSLFISYFLDFFFSIDEIKKLEKKTIGKIISIVFKQFFKNLWAVTGILLFLLAWYIVYNFLNN